MLLDGLDEFMVANSNLRDAKQNIDFSEIFKL